MNQITVMCRSIRVLSNFEPPATEEEMRAAALQYVRKVCGTRKPSKTNQARFDRAVDEITRITREAIEGMESRSPPRKREDVTKNRGRASP